MANVAFELILFIFHCLADKMHTMMNKIIIECILNKRSALGILEGPNVLIYNQTADSVDFLI